MPRFYAVRTVALAFSFAGLPAIQADITPVDSPAPLATIGTISGDVVNIDPVNNIIQVREASYMVQTIRIDEHAEIRKRGETVQLRDLSIGDFVTVNAK